MKRNTAHSFFSVPDGVRWGGGPGKAGFLVKALSSAIDDF